MSLETVLAFETIANLGASHSLREPLLQLLFLQLVFGLQLVAEQREGNYKKAWGLDKGSKQETEKLTEDWEIAKGRNLDRTGRENYTFGLLDRQVEVLIVSCHLGVWWWQLVLQW